MINFKEEIIEYLTTCSKVLNSDEYHEYQKSKVKLMMGQFGVGIALSGQAEEFKQIYREIKDEFPCIIHMGKLVDE